MPVTDDLEPADRRSIPFVESASCRCEGGGASITLAYRAMRTETFEGRKTSFIEAAFHGSKPADLLLGSETVPPNSLEAKMTQFLLACDSRHVVLAFGARVTAWNRATGDPMWIATLPANVGSTKPGPFGLECTKLEVMAGAITLKHASGSTKLSMVDGEPVMP